jgi:nitrile hydratase
MSDNQARAQHDIGGVSTFMCLPVDTGEHALNDFDRRVDAIRQILGQKGVMSVDELRRGVEALPEASYFGLTYYQRWLHSIVDTLVAKGVITPAELADALAAP